MVSKHTEQSSSLKKLTSEILSFIIDLICRVFCTRVPVEVFSNPSLQDGIFYYLVNQMDKMYIVIIGIEEMS
jgi:hypothetical protein